MVQTDRLGFPLLAPGQAQKEVTHNEALAIADLAVQLAVESIDLATPPGSPDAGQCWIVAIGGTGAWLERDGSVAGWTTAGWMFLEPTSGWRAWTLDRANMVRFDGGAWVDEPARSDGFYVAGQRVIGERQSAIGTPSGGVTQDVEARVALGSILAALRTHGLIDS